METFGISGVTAILPAKDGSCYYAIARYVKRLTPHAEQSQQIDLQGSLISRRMEFVPSHDNDERYIQISSGGNWFRGYDVTERLDPTNYTRRPNQMIMRWSHYAYGPCVYENAKHHKWFARQALTFCNENGNRWREGDNGGRLWHDRYQPTATSRIPGTARFLTAGRFGAASNYHGEADLLARVFDAEAGKYEGFDATAVRHFDKPKYPDTDDYLRNFPTSSGTILYYSPDGSTSFEVTTDPVATRDLPPWYPPLKDAVAKFGSIPNAASPEVMLRASILSDRAAWVGLDNALYFRTAQTNKTRRFRPHGNRKVRGCAFAPDGQTLWAFDSACIFRVDVDD